MSWDILPKSNLQYFLQKLKAKFDGKADADDVKGTQTATGNPITITDGSETYAQGLSVELEPKQDLHGYDFPWVGGAGKNLLPLTVDGIKAANGGASTWTGNSKTIGGVAFTILTDSDGNVIGIRCNGQANGFLFYVFSGSITVPSGSKVNLNATKNDGNFDCSVLNNGTGAVSISGHSAKTADVTLSDTTVTRVSCYFNTNYNNDITIYPMIRDASQSADFAPYTNMSPITGITQLDFAGCGKNLAEIIITTETKNGVTYKANTDGTISVSGTPTSYADVMVSVAKVNSNMGIITISGISNANNIRWDRVVVRDADNNVLRTILENSTFLSDSVNLSLYPSADNVGVFVKRSDNNVACSGYLDIQVEKGSSATAFEPYTPNNHTIPLGRTVYGGKLNVQTGELVVDRASVDLGSLTWRAIGATSSYDRYVTNSLDNIIKDYSQCICSIYAYRSPAKGYVANSVSITAPANTLSVFTDVGAYASATAFKTAMSGVQLVYELATPITYHLTPEQVKLLKGYNYITTNADTLELTYQVDNVLGEILSEAEEYTDRAISANKANFEWHYVGSFSAQDTVDIDGEWAEIMIIPYSSVGQGVRIAANSVIYPFSMFGVDMLYYLTDVTKGQASQSSFGSTDFIDENKEVSYYGQDILVYVR